MRLAPTVTPYCGPAPVPAGVWSHWNADPVILGALALGLLLVVLPSRPALNVRKDGMMLALLVLGVAFISPLCALSSALFSARTVHHLLMICAAAPLMAFSLPRPTPQGPRAVLTATVLQAAVLWFWHAPALYAAALSSDIVYAVMEVTLLASALLFWTAIRAATAPVAAFGLVLTMVQMGLLGALLLFASSAVYAPHQWTTAAWGLTPLEDQQLAGLIMWAPAAGLYLVTALVLVGRWLGPDRGPADPAAGRSA